MESLRTHVGSALIFIDLHDVSACYYDILLGLFGELRSKDRQYIHNYVLATLGKILQKRLPYVKVGLWLQCNHSKRKVELVDMLKADGTNNEPEPSLLVGKFDDLANALNGAQMRSLQRIDHYALMRLEQSAMPAIEYLQRHFEHSVEMITLHGYDDEHTLIQAYAPHHLSRGWS